MDRRVATDTILYGHPAALYAMHGPTSERVSLIARGTRARARTSCRFNARRPTMLVAMTTNQRVRETS